MDVYVYLYLKSRNHDTLKELKELDGIIVQRRRAVSDDLGSKVARCGWTPIGFFPVVRFGPVRFGLVTVLKLPQVETDSRQTNKQTDNDIVIVICSVICPVICPVIRSYLVGTLPYLT